VGVTVDYLCMHVRKCNLTFERMLHVSKSYKSTRSYVSSLFNHITSARRHIFEEYISMRQNFQISILKNARPRFPYIILRSARFDFDLRRVGINKKSIRSVFRSSYPLRSELSTTPTIQLLFHGIQIHLIGTSFVNSFGRSDKQPHYPCEISGSQHIGIVISAISSELFIEAADISTLPPKTFWTFRISMTLNVYLRYSLVLSTLIFRL
jgi:hypothetical protein